jgi:hypothetical protein
MVSIFLEFLKCPYLFVLPLNSTHTLYVLDFDEICVSKSKNVTD